ncbi:MAG: hypothetical protein U9Q89_02980, partial [Thermodesulfobacteriota bacterium]|nr:hypothetical protein [Thermodesulfobacteriota bacterium]
GVNDGIVPYEGVMSDSSDPIVKRESEVHERALLYVSATRAKKEVLVTSFAKPSRFLGNGVKSACDLCSRLAIF